MTGVRMEVIIPKKFFGQADRLERIIENTLDAAALAVQIDFQVTTQTWKNRPLFYIRRKRGERFIGTGGKVYGILNAGARPHIIRARNAKRLAFFAKGFRPKSRVNQIVSRKGRQADKDFRRPVAVNHPGVKARKWTHAIKKKWDKELPDILQRAIDAEVC